MNWENILSEEELKEIKKQERLENIKKYGLKDMTLLTTEEIFGSDTCEQSEIFKMFGTRTIMTDFAIVLGGCADTWWWTKTPKNNNVIVVDCTKSNVFASVKSRTIGIRLSIPFSSISKVCFNKKKVMSNLLGNSLFQVEYGEYPQWICSKELSLKLEELYLNNKLNTTEKVYTTDSRKYNEYNKDFELQEHIEYIYNNKKYVRVKVNLCRDNYKFKILNGEKYKDGDYVWIEVSPVEWLIDEKKDIAITKNIILSGIQFNKKRNYIGSNFDEMNIKKFMDKYLSKEIIPDIITYENDNLGKEETLEESLINLQRKADEIMGEFLYLVKDREKSYQKKLKK